MTKRPRVTQMHWSRVEFRGTEPVARELAKCGLNLVEVQEIIWDITRRLYYLLFCRQKNENND